MFKVHTDNSNFNLGIDDYGPSGGTEINIYILEENMSALSLMEAFRACRHNPLRTYYYVPETKSKFSQYARESISRGTVNIFTDLDELRDSLRTETEAWRSHSIPECIQKTAANFKILLNQEAVTSLSVAIGTAMNKNSCYTVALALLHLLLSGESLRTSSFHSSLSQVLEENKAAQTANEEFLLHQSHFLSVLAASGKKADASWHTEEYDGMALHVMFQPFDREMKSLDSRVKIISQLIKERQK